MNSTKVLITGGLGYVGSWTAKLLLNAGYNVRILDNLLSQPGATVLSELKRADILVGDIRYPSDVKAALKGIDIVIHLAAIVGFPACDLSIPFSHSVNVDGTANILRCLDREQTIIFASTTSSYGEKPNTVVSEQTTLEPLTSYGTQKKIGEQLVQSYANNHIIFRPATAFGTSYQARVDVLPNTLSYIAASTGVLNIFEPDVTRVFIHVKDLATAFARAAMGYMKMNEVYNIGNPYLTVTKGELARQIATFSKASITINDGTDPDKRNYIVSFDKMMRTGFVPLLTFEDGYNEIAAITPAIRDNYAAYTTPEKVKEFLSYGGIHHS